MKNKILLTFLTLLCFGCGQKGPLYMPPPEPEEAPQTATPPVPAPGKTQPGQH